MSCFKKNIAKYEKKRGDGKQTKQLNQDEKYLLNKFLKLKFRTLDNVVIQHIALLIGLLGNLMYYQ